MKKLPLVCHWCDNIFTYQKQIELIEAGVPLMVNIDMSETYSSEIINLLRLARGGNLPITIVSTQWEQCLTNGKLDPFMDVEEFKKPADKYFDTAGMGMLQKLYPDPPCIYFLSNNETPKWRWSGLQSHPTFIARYGSHVSDAHKREILRDAWIERFNTMFQTNREKLTSGWKDVAKFIGYKAFPDPSIGRYNNWENYSTHTHEMDDWSFGCWDGCSANYYTHNWSSHRDHWVQSPQIESMNYIPFLRDDYYFELSCWDGNYVWYPNWGYDESYMDISKACQYMSEGQTYTPERYEGYFQFGLWLMRCNVREWRQYNVDSIPWEQWTQKPINCVQRVWNNSVLKKFWEGGELVITAEQHPYNINIPKKWESSRPFYLLAADVNSQDMSYLRAEIPVFAIAYRMGEEFLVYAHAPKKVEKCNITVPGFGTFEAVVPREGKFFHLRKNVVDEVAT